MAVSLLLTMLQHFQGWRSNRGTRWNSDLSNCSLDANRLNHLCRYRHSKTEVSSDIPVSVDYRSLGRISEWVRGQVCENKEQGWVVCGALSRSQHWPTGMSCTPGITQSVPSTWPSSLNPNSEWQSLVGQPADDRKRNRRQNWRDVARLKRFWNRIGLTNGHSSRGLLTFQSNIQRFSAEPLAGGFPTALVILTLRQIEQTLSPFFVRLADGLHRVRRNGLVALEYAWKSLLYLIVETSSTDLHFDFVWRAHCLAVTNHESVHFEASLWSIKWVNRIVFDLFTFQRETSMRFWHLEYWNVGIGPDKAPNVRQVVVCPWWTADEIQLVFRDHNDFIQETTTYNSIKH